MRWRRQAGLTLIEMIIALAISGLVMGSLGAALTQLIFLPQQSSDELTLLHNLRQAAQWISEDARQAQTFTPGTQPDYGTFTWADRSTFPVTTHTVRYYYSNADLSLWREQTVGGSSQAIVVADNVLNYSDVSIGA